MPKARLIFALLAVTLVGCNRSVPNLADWQYRVTDYKVQNDKCVIRATGLREEIGAERKGSCSGIKTGEILTEFSSTERSVTPVGAANQGGERFVVTEAKARPQKD